MKIGKSLVKLRTRGIHETEANHGARSDTHKLLEGRMLAIEDAVKSVQEMQQKQALDYAQIEDRFDKRMDLRMTDLEATVKTMQQLQMMQQLQSHFCELGSSFNDCPPVVIEDHEEKKENHADNDAGGIYLLQPSNQVRAVEGDNTPVEEADEEGVGGGAGYAAVSAASVVTSAVSETAAEIIAHVDAELDTYTLKESVWDAFFLQWFRTKLGIGSGPLDVAATVFLYLANVVIQVLLVYLVFTNMSDKEWVSDSLLDDLLSWRLSVSQGMIHYHPESNTTLATRVCTGDMSRILAEGQAGTQTQIAQYLLYNQPFNGPVLLGCAIIIWLLLIGIEIIQTLEFTSALLSIKHSNHNVGAWHRDDQFTIDGISSSRRCLLAMVIVVPRVFIVGWLCAAGVLYLVHSHTMGDLILNCVALGFVLDTDELLYYYVPKRTAFKLSITRPIKLQHHNLWKREHGIDVGRISSYCVLLLIMPAMLTIWLRHVEPLLDNLAKAHAILCGGKADMAFTTDKSNSVISYANTAPAKVSFSPEYGSIAVMQAIQLHNIPELTEFLKDWPQPDSVYASRTTLENLDSLYRHSEMEAVSEQLCLDLDYSEPGRASLKMLTGMDSCKETSGYDMHGRCTEPVVRRYCPVTCFCHAASGWYDRGGCPPMCEIKYRINLKAVLHEHATQNDGCDDGRGEGIASMAPVGGNLTEFAKSLKLDLRRDAAIDEFGYLLGRWQNSLDMQSLNQCIWRDDAWFDWEELLLSQACDGMTFLSSLFDLGLCDADYMRFKNGLGNIAAYCPDSCQLCPLKDYSEEWPRTIMHSMYKFVLNSLKFHPAWGRFLACGYEWLFCGEQRNGTTIGAKNYVGSLAPDKIYRFYAEPGKLYTFTLSSYSDKTKMKLKIYDPQLQLAGLNLLDEASQLSTLTSLRKNFRATQPGKYHLVVETVDFLQTTDFQVSMSNNMMSCGNAIPLQIHCGEILSAHVGKQTEFDLIGSISLTRRPERIFKFQAEAGVEYTFDSCGSSENTFWYLFDKYLRDPPLLEVDAVPSSNCSQERGHLSYFFAAPGEYNVVVELRKFRSIREAEEIRLAMQCNRHSIP